MVYVKRDTQYAQLGNRSNDITGAVNPPIYLSTAYQHKGLNQSGGYDYTRVKNPTRTILEEGITRLEAGVQGFACASGMAAIQLVLSLFSSGDHVIISHDIYGGTYRLLEHLRQVYNLDFTYADFKDVQAVQRCIRRETRAIFLESPTNPLLDEIDLKTYATLTKSFDLLFIVDNTFYTPYLQRPLTLGADIVVHSATKYLAGHNDVLAGLVVVKAIDLAERLHGLHSTIGAVLAPLDAWLVIRGMKTLPLRMRQHQTNAKAIAEFLRGDDRIGQVRYPGKGGMLSFQLKESSWVSDFLEKLQIITFAESLGGVESFITYPMTQTHADMPEAERVSRGIDDRLLRFSVGIEDCEDLIDDLLESLNQFNKK